MQCETYLQMKTFSNNVDETICKAIVSSSLISDTKEQSKLTVLKHLENWVKLYQNNPPSGLELAFWYEQLVKLFKNELFIAEIPVISRLVMKDMLPEKIKTDFPNLSVATFTRIITSYINVRTNMLSSCEARRQEIIAVSKPESRMTEEEELKLNKQIVSDEFDGFCRTGDVLDLLSLTYNIFVNNGLIAKNHLFDSEEATEMNRYVSKKIDRIMSDEKEKFRNFFNPRNPKDASIAYQKNFLVQKVFRLYIENKQALLDKIVKP